MSGSEMYDWEIMETEMEPKFKEAALNFRDGKHSFACPRKDELNEDLQESFPFLDEMAESEVVESYRNPNGAGRKGQDFISYLKAFLLAPVLRVEQNSEAMSFGNNYRNPVNTGTPRDVHWDSPTLHPKWEVAPDIPIRTGKYVSMLRKSAKNTMDNNSGFC